MPLVRSVLVADPDPDARAIVRAYFECQGIAVTEVHGVRCVQASRRSQPDVIVLELGRNQEDGLRTLRLLKANPATAAIPVVVHTTNVLPEVLQRARECGCAEAVAKPIPPQDLLARVEAVVVARAAPRKSA